MNIKTFYFNPYRECTYIVSNDEGNCIVIDPGMYSDSEKSRFGNYLRNHQLNPVAILITHRHPDHICGQEYIEDNYPGIPVNPATVAGFPFSVIATPGHKEDSVCYYFESEKTVFTGDTLFQESIGRTDLLGGDMGELMKSLAKLSQLPDDTQVYPGHGYPTTILHEKEYNPYL